MPYTHRTEAVDAFVSLSSTDKINIFAEQSSVYVYYPYLVNSHVVLLVYVHWHFAADTESALVATIKAV